MVSLLKVLPALKKRRDTPLLSSGTAGFLPSPAPRWRDQAHAARVR